MIFKSGFIVGLDPGTVVLTEKAVDGEFSSSYKLVSILNTLFGLTLHNGAWEMIT